ncbi:MAG: hypothetical protein AAFX10_16910, partial [Pseudomonadota bacterium]
GNFLVVNVPYFNRNSVGGLHLIDKVMPVGNGSILGSKLHLKVRPICRICIPNTVQIKVDGSCLMKSDFLATRNLNGDM